MAINVTAKNSRLAKAAFLYDGHNRRPGVALGSPARRWRHLRRLWATWMRQNAEAWDA